MADSGLSPKYRQSLASHLVPVYPSGPPRGRPYGRGTISDIQAWDYQVSSIIYRDLGQKLPRQCLLFLEYTGGGLLIPLFLILGCFPSQRLTLKFRAFCLNMVLGFLTDLLLVGTLKFLVRRHRPVYNDAGDYILVVNVDRYSFPSGHASRAIFVAVLWVIWQLGAWWIQSIICWWALLTTLSRVLLGRHYFLDVAAGVFVGILNALIISQVLLQLYCRISVIVCVSRGG